MKTSIAFELEETRNIILGALSQEEAEQLKPHLRPREFALGAEIGRPDEMADDVLFPESGMLSSIMRSKQNVGVEVSVVGREGVHNALLALNAVPRIDQVTVQVPGWGWSLPSPILRQEFRMGGTLQRKVLRYLDLSHTQAAATGVCNRLHTIEERLARWLLIVRGAAEADEFEMPAEFVAAMLGSRLSGVPIAVGVLQQAGLIMADGGFIHLLDVPALELTACECHTMLAERLHIYLNDPEDNQGTSTPATARGSHKRHNDGQHMVLAPGRAIQYGESA